MAFVFKGQCFVFDACFLQGSGHHADIFGADGGVLHTLDDEQASDDILDEVNRRGMVILFRDLVGAAAK